MAIALALFCALFYGAADFYGGLATRRVAALSVVVWSQASGLAVLAVALVFMHGVPFTTDLEWAALSGIAAAFGVTLLYRALAIGVMGVVSPLTAVLAAVLPVVWGIVRGERPALLAFAGIGCALVAVVLVSMQPREVAEGGPRRHSTRAHGLPPGILEAIGAGCAFGFLFIGLAQTRHEAGLWPLLATRIVSLLLLVCAAFATRTPLRLERPGARMILVTGALDMSANVFYVLAAHIGALSIVAVLASLYPAGTVALAATILKERLAVLQWVGVAIAFGGVLCISLA